MHLSGKKSKLKSYFFLICRYFKLIDKTFYIFENENSRKAEQIFDLSQWTVLITERPSDERGAAIESTESCHPVIVFENPMQLGCSFKTDNAEKTNEIYQSLQVHEEWE
jgi:hypothetical protein